MKKSFLNLTFLTATAMGFGTIHAMDEETIHRDSQHDKVFQRWIEDHQMGDLLSKHLRPASNKKPVSGEPVKIFDINELHERRCAEVHAMARKKALDPVRSTSYVSALLSVPSAIVTSPYYVGKYIWNSLPNFRSAPPPESPQASSETEESETQQPRLQPRRVEDTSYDGGAVSKDPEYMVLGLMGGGLRARMEADWLEKLESITNRRSYELFDEIGGTSAGGFLSLGLALSEDGSKPVKSISELKDLIRNQAPKFFPQDNHYSWNVLARLKDEMDRLFYTQYDPKFLDEFLQKDFEGMTLGTALTKIFVTTVRADENEIFLLGSDSHPDVLGRIAGRATGAAPTYFPGVEFRDKGKTFTLVDGGVGANDPTLIAMMEVRRWAQLLQKPRFSYNQLTVVTFGTGDMPVASLLSPNAGKLPAAAAVVEMAMSTNVNGTHRFIKETLPEGSYLYCNPKLKEVTGLDFLTDKQAADLDAAAESEMGKIEDWVARNEVLRKRLERLNPGEKNITEK